MRYLTDRKRAEGKGSAHRGTEAHWAQSVSAVALAFMVPTWIWIFGRALGSSRAAVVATFHDPFVAVLTALVLVVGMRHFARGSSMMIEDYTHGTARKIALLFVYFLAGVIAATGLYALIKMAL